MQPPMVARGSPYTCADLLETLDDIIPWLDPPAGCLNWAVEAKKRLRLHKEQGSCSQATIDEMVSDVHAHGFLMKRDKDALLFFY